MNKQMTWDLSSLYKSQTDAALAKDWQRAKELVDQLGLFRGKVTQLKTGEFLPLIQTWEELSIIIHRINLYAGLLESTHVNVAEVTRFVKTTEEQTVTITNEILFLDVELSQLTQKQWQALLSEPDLQPYHHFIEKLAQQAKHTLSEIEEKILNEKGQTSQQALLHLYSVTTDTLAAEWDNETITLEELLSKFHSPSAEIRKKAGLTLYQTLKKNDKTTPAILNTLIQDKTITDRLRHYDYPEQSRYYGDDVDKETVEAMLEAVTSSYGLVHEYYELKKKILGQSTLYWWDRYAPLPDIKTKIDLETAKAMVLNAYEHFSPELAEIITRLIKTEHIDWLPSPTKRGGAFCAFGGPTSDPYVLMNYTENPRDVMTLAHELGHAVHDVLAAENTFFQTHPSLALAEIASVFGETLLFDQLMQGDINKQDKIALMMSFIEDRFATVFRQATMFRFEQKLHAQRRASGELSKEEIDELWDSTMKEPFASSLNYTDEHRNSWMYVSHIFHWPFYVYSYAFAQLCVLSLYRQYQKEGRAFVPTYLAILKAGGSMSPKENLAQAGHDLSQPDFWKAGLVVIADQIEELRQLTKS